MAGSFYGKMAKRQMPLSNKIHILAALYVFPCRLCVSARDYFGRRVEELPVRGDNCPERRCLRASTPSHQNTPSDAPR